MGIDPRTGSDLDAPFDDGRGNKHEQNLEALAKQELEAKAKHEQELKEQAKEAKALLKKGLQELEEKKAKVVERVVQQW